MKDSDRDQYGFIKFDRDFIFIASSSDVEDERAIVQIALQDEIRELGEELHVYSYDTEMEGTVMDQRTSMQKSIPRPSSENCKGVVYILGERFGLPLEEGFDPDHLGQSKSWMAAKNFPLVLDWPTADSEKRKRLLKKGAFPLTGGLFEFLAARGAAGEGEFGKPVLFILLAEQPLASGGGKITLNKHRWLTSEIPKLNPDQILRWQQEVHVPELDAVHNFLRACIREGIDQNPTLDPDKMRRDARNFVRTEIFKREGEDQNPYRELRYYDENHSHFYGRDDYINTVVDALNERLKQSTDGAACCIWGPSGSGKSSVLRAGILRRLKDQRNRGAYFCSILRPDMFKSSAGTDIDVLETMLDKLERDGAPVLPAKIRSGIRQAGASAPFDAADAVLNALKSQRKPPEFFVLALDQFEEIIDEMVSRARKDYWRPMFRFLERLSSVAVPRKGSKKIPAFGLIYTLESSREEQARRLDLAEPFKSALWKELPDATETFIEQVIRFPFVRTEYPLGQSVIDTLREEFEVLRDREGRTARNSVLPLLALKLHDLWDHVAANFERKQGIDTENPQFIRGEDKISISELTSTKWDPGFASVVNDLATKAWRRAGVGVPDSLGLSGFLQPLVGFEGENLQLTVGKRDAPYQDEYKVIESFRKHRLLIDVGDGQVRLVHQTVLDHWNIAERWTKDNREFLEREAAMRIEASNWNQQGRPRIGFRGKNLLKKIDTAVEILYEYIRAWSLARGAIKDTDVCLRDYSLTLFGRSETPRKAIATSTILRSSHVRLAAMYGLVDLLGKFGKLDPNSLSDPLPEGGEGICALGGAGWSQLESVKFLLSQGVDPVGRSEDGWPAIYGAIKNNREDIFLVLLEAASKRVNGKSLQDMLILPEGFTLAHVAAEFNNLSMLRELLERRNFAPDARNSHGQTPIHVACLNDAIDVFDYLRLEVGITEISDWFNFSCIHYAAINGAKRVLDRLLSVHDSEELLLARDSNNSTALHLAARFRHADCVEALLKHGLDVNEGLIPPIHQLFLGVPGAKVFSSDALLLEKPDLETITTLICAVVPQDGKFDLNHAEKVLLEAGVTADTTESFCKRLENEFVDDKGILDVESAAEAMVRRDNVADDDFDQDRAVDTLRALLKSSEIQPNIPNRHDRRPIGVVEHVRPLLRELLKHPDLNLNLPLDSEGDLGIFIAAREGEWHAVKRYLDEHGLPSGVQADAEGNSFLHQLTAQNSPKGILFETISEASKEQLNVRNKRGRTVFHRALNSQNWELATKIFNTDLLDLHQGDSFLNWELYVALNKTVACSGSDTDYDAGKALIVKLIEKLGSKGLRQSDVDGWTLLHHIVGANSSHILELFSELTDLSRVWGLKDPQGRRPEDLATEKIAELVPVTDNKLPASEVVGWDAGLVWKPTSDKRRINAVASLALNKGEERGLVVEQSTLAFYPKKAILRISYRPNGKQRPTYYFLASGQKLTRLDGTSPPIHGFNADHLRLKPEIALRYLHFFCFFVRGEEGPFFILEDPEAAQLSDSTNAKDRAIIQSWAMPTWFRGHGDGKYRFLSRVFYSNAIFSAHFTMYDTGMIEMEDDTPLAADLSGQVQMPIK